MTEKRFYTDGQYVMQDREVYVICNGKHNADVVATALNELLEENKELKKKNIQLNREKERYKQLSEIRDENINNRILSLKEFINNCEDEKVKNALEDLFYSEVKEYNLAKENRKLKKENKFLRCTIESNSQDDYIDYLKKQNERLKERITELASNDKIVFMNGQDYEILR